MEYIKLNNSDLNVSRICFGCCPMGEYGWGDVQEKELFDAVDVAIDNGINFFDTADTYGLGQSEINLGKALKGKRDKVFIASKFGVRVENGKTFYDNSPEYIETAINNSLSRLNTDHIDLYQIHYRDNTPLNKVVKKLEELKKNGKIRYYGLSNIHKKDIDEIIESNGEFSTFQDEYSLATRKNEDDMKFLSEKLDLNPMTWGSLGQGILTGKYDKNTIFDKNDRRSRDIYVNFHGDKLLKNLEIVDLLKKFSNEKNHSIASCAIRFILDYFPTSIVLTGIKKPSQVYSNIEAVDWKYKDEELDMLNEVSEFSRGGVIFLLLKRFFKQTLICRLELA